jgi:hypothetical protein
MNLIRISANAQEVRPWETGLSTDLFPESGGKATRLWRSHQRAQDRHADLPVQILIR